MEEGFATEDPQKIQKLMSGILLGSPPETGRERRMGVIRGCMAHVANGGFTEKESVKMIQFVNGEVRLQTFSILPFHFSFPVELSLSVSSFFVLFTFSF
jgi:hypothetical protein